MQKPKTVNGAAVSGEALVTLAQEYCKAINDNAVPTIHSAWSSVVRQQLRSSLKEAVRVYRARRDEGMMPHLPMGQDQLHEIHKAAKGEAMRVFQSPQLDEGMMPHLPMGQD